MNRLEHARLTDLIDHATEIVAGWDLPDHKARAMVDAALAADPTLSDPRALAVAAGVDFAGCVNRGNIITVNDTPSGGCVACSQPATVLEDRCPFCDRHGVAWRTGVARALAVRERAVL